MPISGTDRARQEGGRTLANWESETAFHPESEPMAFSLARILLVAVLLGSPLAFGAVVPWAWAGLGIAAALGLVLWAAGCLQRRVVKLVWSPLYIPSGLFFLLGVFQYVAGITLDASETRKALLLLFTDLAFFFLAVQLFGSGRTRALRVFGLLVLIFAGSLGLFAILESASGVHRIYGIVDTPFGALYGPYVNRDHFAGLMEMLLPVAILYIAGRHGGFSLEASVWRVSAVALAIASFLLSGSRGGLAALAVEIVIAAALIARGRSRSGQSRRLAVAAAFALVVGVALFAYVDPGWVSKKLGSVAYPHKTWKDWASDRKRMAADGLHMWADHPLLGVGLGDFETAYPPYQSLTTDMWIDHAHNDYVEAAAETGLVGALLVLSALVLFLFLAFRDSGQPVLSQAAAVRVGAAIGCCGLLVHSLADFNLHIPANAAWFAVLAGIATTARPAGAAEDSESISGY